MDAIPSATGSGATSFGLESLLPLHVSFRIPESYPLGIGVWSESLYSDKCSYTFVVVHGLRCHAASRRKARQERKNSLRTLRMIILVVIAGIYVDRFRSSNSRLRGAIDCSVKLLENVLASGLLRRKREETNVVFSYYYRRR